MKHVPGRNGGTLQQAEKGECLNPKGRPRKLPEIDKLLADVLGSDDDESPAKAILQALVKKAKAGDTRAAEILLDRGWGKAKQAVSVELTQPVKSITIEPASKGQ